jgi:hypothetical protein
MLPSLPPAKYCAVQDSLNNWDINRDIETINGVYGTSDEWYRVL